MTEWRRHQRIKVTIDVQWSAGFLGFYGAGTIRNISLSGILLEVDDRFKASQDGLFAIDAIDLNSERFFPREVKLIWFNRIKTDKLRKFCGMKFINNEGPILTRLAQHIEHRRSTYYEATDINIIQNYLSQSN